MGWLHSTKADCVYAFTSGQTMMLEQVEDEAFSKGLLGKGIAVKSKDGKFYSPVDGVVTMVFPTMHAVGIKSREGADLILHVGIDTVKLQGKGFHALVKDGSAVKKGDLLLEADLKLIEGEGYDPVSMLVVTDPMNCELQYTSVTECREKKDILFKIKRTEGD